MSVERIIGIDFGTSTSLVKVKAYRDGQPVDGDPTSTQVVEFDNGRVTTPTLIRFAGDAEYYGQDAVSPKLDSTLCKNFKLDLQSPDPAAKAQAQELTRKFFRFLYEQYSGQSTRFGQFDAERTLVSYPAKWKPETREFMLQAARDAGFQHVSGMDEPTAALYTVMVQESARLVQQGYLTAGKPAYVLMIDMGAGTTDLALCRYTPGGRNRIIDTWPPAESKVLFGGREMDELLIRYLADYLKRCNLPEKMVTTLEKNNLEDCKAWKENTVSSALARGATADECAFVTSMLMWAGENTAPFPAIDRAVLEDYCKDYIGRYAELIAGAMAHARQAAPEFDAGDLALAVLTGGHSQWYFAKDMLCCTLPGYEGGVGVRLSANQVVTLKPPQHTVSSGLVFSPQFDTASDGDNGTFTFDFSELGSVDIFGEFFAPFSPKEKSAGQSQPEQRERQVYDTPTPPPASHAEPRKAQKEPASQNASPSTDTDEFNVILRSVGAQKGAVSADITIFRGCELTEAFKLVDSTPCVLVQSVTKKYAERIRTSLVEKGAEVEIVPKNSPSTAAPQSGAKQQQTYTSSSTAQQTTPPKNSGFDILLKSPGANGIAVIKAVRDITGLELGDAKRIVDSAPGVVKSGVSKNEAETIKNRLAELGAMVEITEKPSASDCTSSDKEATTGPILRYPEQVKQLKSLTALEDAECDRILMGTGGNLKRAMENVYGSMIRENDEEFVQRVARSKIDNLFLVSAAVKDIFQRSGEKLGPKEKFLFYFDWTFTGMNKNFYLFTNQRLFHFDKKFFKNEYSSSWIAFANVSKFFLFGIIYINFECSVGGMGVPCNVKRFQFMAAAYLRWRAQHGLDPYDIEPTVE